MYIDSLADQLQNANCGIECAGEIIPFADNTALLPLDESAIKTSLDVLVQWCRPWGGGGGEDKCEQVWNHACEAKENGIGRLCSTSLTMRRFPW